MNQVKRSASCELSEHLTIRCRKMPRLSADVDSISCIRDVDQNKATESFKSFQERVRHRFDAYTMVAYKLMEQGELKLAESFFDLAIQAGRNSLGVHPEVATMLNKLGNLYYEMKDFKSAMKCYEEGLEIESVVLPPNHPSTIITMTNIARIHEHQKRYSVALSAYDQVRIMQEETFGKSSIEIAATLSAMGLMQYNMKCFSGSFDLYQEALRIRRSYYGTDEHPNVASSLNSVGLVLFKRRMYQLAKNCFMASLRIRIKLLGRNHRQVAILYFNIATLHFEQGDDEQAVLFYKEALRVERAALGEDHPEISCTLQQIAEVLHQAGHLNEAIAYYYEAILIERKNSSLNSVAKILQLIGNIQLEKGNVHGMMVSYTEAYRIHKESWQFDGGMMFDESYNLRGLSKLNPACAPVA